VVLFTKGQLDDDWVEQGQTETMYNNLNPDFKTEVQVSYHFEQNQLLLCKVFDKDPDEIEDCLLATYEVPLN
jgi:hypothetical protein